MKRLLTLGLISFAASASAQVNFNIPGMTPEQQSALMQMMGPVVEAEQKVEVCLKGELGGTAMQRMQDMGQAMNKEILPLCKAGRKAEAHAVAVRYSETDEGHAAMKCGGEIRPILADPRSAKMLGRYAPMATALANGSVPDDVCSGLKTGTPASGSRPLPLTAPSR